MIRTIIHFASDVLGMDVTAEVLLPDAPVDPETQPFGYPCLYLLHGLHGSCHDWMRRTSLERYAQDRGWAIVMPSALNSGYVNMAHGDRYYDFISEELPYKMGSFFPLSARRQDRAIAGLSMGGFGALMIGLSKPENYCAIGCFSAGLDFSDVEGIKPYADLAVGEGKKPTGYQDAYSSVNAILDQGRLRPRIYHCIGEDDYLLGSARRLEAFMQAPSQKGFDYTFILDEGTHNWDYWDKHLTSFLDWLTCQ